MLGEWVTESQSEPARSRLQGEESSVLCILSGAHAEMGPGLT